jgi:hypothetical protein
MNILAAYSNGDFGAFAAVGVCGMNILAAYSKAKEFELEQMKQSKSES